MKSLTIYVEFISNLGHPERNERGPFVRKPKREVKYRLYKNLCFFLNRCYYCQCVYFSCQTEPNLRECLFLLQEGDPRTEKMPVDQDWTAVYPSAAPFRPNAVPLPLRMGYPVKGGVPPGKKGNLELIKVSSHYYHMKRLGNNFQKSMHLVLERKSQKITFPLEEYKSISATQVFLCSYTGCGQCSYLQPVFTRTSCLWYGGTVFFLCGIMQFCVCARITELLRPDSICFIWT